MKNITGTVIGSQNIRSSQTAREFLLYHTKFTGTETFLIKMSLHKGSRFILM